MTKLALALLSITIVALSIALIKTSNELRTINALPSQISSAKTTISESNEYYNISINNFDSTTSGEKRFAYAFLIPKSEKDHSEQVAIDNNTSATIKITHMPQSKNVEFETTISRCTPKQSTPPKQSPPAA